MTVYLLNTSYPVLSAGSNVLAGSQNTGAPHVIDFDDPNFAKERSRAARCHRFSQSGPRQPKKRKYYLPEKPEEEVWE